MSKISGHLAGQPVVVWPPLLWSNSRNDRGRLAAYETSPHRPGNVRTRDDGAALRGRRLRLVQGGDLPAAFAPFVDVRFLLAQGEDRVADDVT
jgi:hypothetical protein